MRLSPRGWTSHLAASLLLLSAALVSGCGANAEQDWYYHWDCHGDWECLSTNPTGAAIGTRNEGPVLVNCTQLMEFARRFWNMPPATNSCDHSPATPLPPPPVPTITTLVPTGGTQGTTVTLSGSGFPSQASGVTVTLGGVAAPVTGVTSNQVVFTVPGLPAGSYPVTVTTAGGSATSAGSFALRDPILTVSIAGSGSVVSAPAGITCAAGTCTASFPFGTKVALTETAAASAVFNGWMGGGCAGTGAGCSVTMDSDQTVTASFLSETLTVIVAGQGRVVSTPGGIDCSGMRSACTASFAPATVVTLTETAGRGNVPATFAGWSGGTCPPMGTTCTVTLDANVTITATFLTFSLTVVPVAVNATSGTGTITSVPAGINCAGVGPSATNCLGWFAGGTTVTLTAAPDASSSFAGWVGSGCSGSGPCSVMLDANSTVTGQYCIPHGSVIATTPGATNLVACASTLAVQAWGAGGGGGGNGNVTTGYGGSGGGGGGYGAASVNVITGDSLVVTVGAGGAAGAGFHQYGPASNGGDGGNSSFGTLVVATGGRGGTAGPTAGGAGGTSAAPTNVAGGPGLVGMSVAWGGGGAGGAGGNGGAGGAGGAGVDYNNPPPVIPQSNGFPGGLPGGGGGGGGWHWFYSYDGGAGADGKLIVTW